MNIVFVNDSTSNPNWGDRAAATALRTMMDEVGGTIVFSLTELDLGLTRLDGGPPAGWEQAHGESAAHRLVRLALPPGVAAVGRRFEAVARGTSPGGVVPDTFEGFAAAAARLAGPKTPAPALSQALQQADVMVIHGDGAMTGNGIIPRTMLLLAYVTKKHYEKPVILVSHTADFSHPGLRGIAAEVYPLIDDVVFRDPISVERCRGLCDGRFAPDPGFMFVPAPRETWAPLARRATYFDVWPDAAPFEPDRPYVCLGGSSILATSPDQARIVAGYRAVIEAVRATYDGQIVLTVSDLFDQPVLRPLARELGLPLVGLVTPLQQVVDILGNADAYVGGRWHPSICALRGGTPLVPLSAKTAKMQALAQMVGLETVLPDALDLKESAQAIGRQLRSLVDRGATLRRELREWAETQAHDCRENVAFLKSLGGSE